MRVYDLITGSRFSYKQEVRGTVYQFSSVLTLSSLCF